MVPSTPKDRSGPRVQRTPVLQVRSPAAEIAGGAPLGVVGALVREQGARVRLHREAEPGVGEAHLDAGAGLRVAGVVARAHLQGLGSHDLTQYE